MISLSLSLSLSLSPHLSISRVSIMHGSAGSPQDDMATRTAAIMAADLGS